MLIYIFLEISFVVGKYDVMLFFYYYFYFGETRPYALKPKTFFLYVFVFFLRKKTGILILDLYLYGIKIQTNIKSF